MGKPLIGRDWLYALGVWPLEIKQKKLGLVATKRNKNKHIKTVIEEKILCDKKRDFKKIRQLVFPRNWYIQKDGIFH